MTELTWGIVLFAALMAVYTLGWLAGHEHCSRWLKKEATALLRKESEPIEETNAK